MGTSCSIATTTMKRCGPRGTNGKPVNRAIMQGDGNFVCCDANNHAYWATGTNGSPVSYIVLQDDGNLVVTVPTTAHFGHRIPFRTGTRSAPTPVTSMWQPVTGSAAGRRWHQTA